MQCTRESCFDGSTVCLTNPSTTSVDPSSTDAVESDAVEATSTFTPISASAPTAMRESDTAPSITNAAAAAAANADDGPVNIFQPGNKLFPLAVTIIVIGGESLSHRPALRH